MMQRLTQPQYTRNNMADKKNDNGAGRPYGARSRKTELLMKWLEEASLKFDQHEHPLYFLIKVSSNEKLPIETRVMAAKSALPFVARSLQRVELTGADGNDLFQPAELSRDEMLDRLNTIATQLNTPTKQLN
jgi:hypothetical protein